MTYRSGWRRWRRHGNGWLDVARSEQSFEKISRDKGPFEKGIDGIYKNARPPPDYVIGEAKYGGGGLGKTRDGRQMGDDWVNGTKTGFDRLETAVGKEIARDIRRSMAGDGVEKWLLRVDESGNVTKQVLDVAGYVIK